MTDKLYEIENKVVLNIPEAEFEDKVRAAHYRLVSEENEKDIYYSRNDVDYMKTVECLRIRRRDDFSEITYKPPTNNKTDIGNGIIAKRETNVILSSPDQAVIAVELFENIGLINLVEVDKHRKTFKKDDNPHITVTIDIVKKAGVFVEIEVMSRDQEDAKMMIKQIGDELGTNSMEPALLPYRDLVMAS